MRRQDKYPDTDTFHYFNANPKNRITEDCAVRAISVACEKPYNQVVMDLAEIQCQTGYDGSGKQGIDLLMKKYGWVMHKQPRKSDGRKYTGSEFCKKVATDNERYLANVGGHHIVAIVDCKIWDMWNSTGGCIGNYWTKDKWLEQ